MAIKGAVPLAAKKKSRKKQVFGTVLSTLYAVFVPALTEAGLAEYIDAGIIPRFAWCPAGVQWFKDRDGWQDSGYTPCPGDIIFFDWEPDGECDHVGIVESVADGNVNTTLRATPAIPAAGALMTLAALKSMGMAYRRLINS